MAVLKSLGVHPKASCACEARRREMDRWGVEGCRANRSTILGWLREAYDEANWGETVKSGLWALLQGAPLTLEAISSYFAPDGKSLLAIDKENNVDVGIKSRPLALFGRYVKKSRGVPQKQDRCVDCEGRGCDSCGNTGMSGYGSVEGVVAKGLVELTGGQAPKFSWIGSEDQGSLVLGAGRPFYVRVFNPKKRKLKKSKVKGVGISATLKVIVDEPGLQPRFKVKTKILAKCEKELSRQDMKKLGSLAGTDVSFENKSKTATKRIHSARARRMGEVLVFAGERRGRDLRQHEAGVEARLRRQERRQLAEVWIRQQCDPALRERADLGQRERDRARAERAAARLYLPHAADDIATPLG